MFDDEFAGNAPVTDPLEEATETVNLQATEPEAADPEASEEASTEATEATEPEVTDSDQAEPVKVDPYVEREAPSEPENEHEEAVLEAELAEEILVTSDPRSIVLSLNGHKFLFDIDGQAILRDALSRAAIGIVR